MKISEIAERVRRLSAREFGELVREASGLLSRERERDGGVVEIAAGGSALVFGDAHGDFTTLSLIVARELTDEFLGGDNVVVFLGDYVDRGPGQVETLALALALKVEFPEKVVLLRGNHEPPPWLIPYPHDFPAVLRSRYGFEGELIYREEVFPMFQKLAHAAHSKSVFFVHGGVPHKAKKLDELKRPDPGVLEELLWNDPVDGIPEVEYSWRGAGFHFGPNVTARFLEANGLKAVVRGHEPCDGFKFNHGGAVLTVFSRLGPPYMNSRAGYLLLPLGEEPSREALEASLRFV